MADSMAVRAALVTRDCCGPERDQLVRLLEVAYWSDAEGRLFKRDPYILVTGMSE